MQDKQTELKAIGTPYEGYTFRSRNEGKWAVFFSHLGLKYRYEGEDMHDGRRRVLPDFFLPDLGVYLEVKHSNFSENERNTFINKYSTVTATTGFPCIIAYGDPRESTTDKEWNKSVMLFMGVPSDVPSFSCEPTLRYSRTWFSSDDEGIYLATNINTDKCSIVVRNQGKWLKKPYLWTPNKYGRDVEKVALYARQYQFEYVETPPVAGSREAENAIEAVWRTKNAPKAVYAGSEMRPAPAWAN